MIVGLKTQEQIVADESTAIQNYSQIPFEFPVGSVLRALVEAHGRTAIWLESIAQFVLARTRLATSTGEYVDSFIADFSLTRGPGSQSIGFLTFSSYSTTEKRIVTIGSKVQTTNGLLTFEVTLDTTNVNYSAADNGYVLNIGIASISVPAKCTIVGLVGNVLANTITLIVSPITGISNVSNPLAFSGGEDQQSDAAVRIAFVNYLNGLKRANEGALLYAIFSVNGVTDGVVVENENVITGDEYVGYFYAVIDDGTGDPPDTLVSAVHVALFDYRGFTIRYGVIKPVVVAAIVTATVTLPDGYTDLNIKAFIETSIATYINSLKIGGHLYYWRLGVIIGDAINAYAPDQKNLFNVSNILLNGSTGDLGGNTKQKVRLTSATITLVGS